MWWQVGLLAAMLVLTPLLPRRARRPEPTAAQADEPVVERAPVAA